ncbi:HDIG domain-containing metalloprotein [Draconibacterium halophilum]|uniref:HDIG domain-containing protein n=1 Tax=Draconibacterium halophilum TaxID=2706887 RepID=A0A6C0RCR5_9BACT|nr:HDIG domain-containing metalloprotein [Draconibacterium halophilum]QIA08284.1 HDIG domain-containing protein [Draconibacterium halophilum]
MITRDEALELLKSNVQAENMLKHSLASEAVLRAMARHLGKNEEEWGIAGLLHDIDVEITNADANTHGPYAEKLLRRKISDEMLDAIVMHNEVATGKDRTTEFQHALAAGETITGLITATALVYPDKKLASVKTKSVTKRMKQKAFAASVKRENIMECEKIGIPLREFADLAVNAMRTVSDDLGL